MAFSAPAEMKATQKRLFLARNPVTTGPTIRLTVLTMLMVPIIAVRCLAGRMAARKAERGATSIDCVQARSRTNVAASGKEDGSGIMARKTADGRCVKTIVYRYQLKI